jgi:hypothetical protein
MAVKIKLLSKHDLAEENHISRSNGKIEPVSQQVGGFLQGVFASHQSRILRHAFNVERQH